MAATNPNLSRRTLVAARTEASYNVDSQSGVSLTTTASTAMLLWDEVNPISVDTQVIDKQVVRASFSDYPYLIGRQLYMFKPKTLLMNSPGGSGQAPDSGDLTAAANNTGNNAVAGVPPFFSHLLRACALAEGKDVTGGSVVYTPVSTGFKSATAYVFADGIRHIITGMYGNCVFTGAAGEGIEMAFDMKGSYLDPTVTAIPSSVVYPADQKAIMKSSGMTMTRVAGYNDGAYRNLPPIARSFKFDLGVQVIERKDFDSPVGLLGLWITNRKPTLNLVVEVEQNLVSFNPWASLGGAETMTIQLTHGATSPNRCRFFWRETQLRNVQYQDDQGIRTYALDYSLTSAADDQDSMLTFF